MKCIDDDSSICEACESGYKKEENGQCVAQPSDKSCEPYYYLSQSEFCLPCPSSCSSCLSSSFCTKCRDGSTPDDDGKCEECFEKIHGCEGSNCDYDNNKCTKCLRSFSLENGQCNTGGISVSTPQFQFRGYGEFQKGKKKISFKMYFKLNSGMMYGCEMRFVFYMELRKRVLEKRKLQDKKTGYCYQVGIAEGDQASVPTAYDKLVVMHCTGDADDTESDAIIKVYEAKFIQINNSPNEEPVVKEEDEDDEISKFTTSEIYDNFVKGGTWYGFNQNGKCRCSYSNDAINFKLNGEVISNKTVDDYIYIIQTSRGNATCKLNKPKNDSESSTLNCIINNNNDNKKGFTLEDDQEAFDSSTTSTLNLLMANANKELCNGEDDSIQPSSSGLSGGAIAGTIVACVVGVAVIGAIIFVVSKGMIAKGAIAGASYTSTPELTQVSKGNLTADKLGEYSV